MKRLSRFIALALVLALVADPTLASAVATSRPSTLRVASKVFAAEALGASLVSAVQNLFAPSRQNREAARERGRQWTKDAIGRGLFRMVVLGSLLAGYAARPHVAAAQQASDAPDASLQDPMFDPMPNATGGYETELGIIENAGQVYSIKRNQKQVTPLESRIIQNNPFVEFEFQLNDDLDFTEATVFVDFEDFAGYALKIEKQGAKWTIVPWETIKTGKDAKFYADIYPRTTQAELPREIDAIHLKIPTSEILKGAAPNARITGMHVTVSPKTSVVFRTVKIKPNGFTLLDGMSVIGLVGAICVAISGVVASFAVAITATEVWAVPVGFVVAVGLIAAILAIWKRLRPKTIPLRKTPEGNGLAIKYLNHDIPESITYTFADVPNTLNRYQINLPKMGLVTNKAGDCFVFYEHVYTGWESGHKKVGYGALLTDANGNVQSAIYLTGNPGDPVKNKANSWHMNQMEAYFRTHHLRLLLPQEIMDLAQPIFAVKLEDLELSVPTDTQLMEAGIRNIRDMTGASARQLKNKNVSKKAIREARDVLTSYGLAFKGEMVAGPRYSSGGLKTLLLAASSLVLFLYSQSASALSSAHLVAEPIHWGFVARAIVVPAVILVLSFLFSVFDHIGSLINDYMENHDDEELYAERMQRSEAYWTVAGILFVTTVVALLNLDLIIPMGIFAGIGLVLGDRRAYKIYPSFDSFKRTALPSVSAVAKQDATALTFPSRHGGHYISPGTQRDFLRQAA